MALQGRSPKGRAAPDRHHSPTYGSRLSKLVHGANIESMTPPESSAHTVHPVTRALTAQRAENLQLMIADRITGFAGSMPFVYLHAGAFGCWMLLVERSPWPTLTLIVSLEAIFLSTFVMIGQNRQAAFQQAKADHDFVESELELKTNTELTRQIHTLTTELHRRVVTEGRN
jgi:uncharacterized membrane protein